MSRIDRNQTFINGILQGETTSEVDDETILRESAHTRLEQAYDGLRQWAEDAQTNYDDWPNKTAGQKDTVNREVIRRFGILCDRLADAVTRIN